MKVCKIKKGKHHSSCSRLKFHIKKNNLKFTASFGEGCIYDLNNNDQHDINKLFGLSYGFHHKNSARFGWRWNIEKEKIEILAYVYRNGKRINEWDENIHIAEIDPILAYEFELRINNGHYIFSLNDYKNVFTRRIKYGKRWFWGYHLYPYFGGNRKAPQDMLIVIS